MKYSWHWIIYSGSTGPGIWTIPAGALKPIISYPLRKDTYTHLVLPKGSLVRRWMPYGCSTSPKLDTQIITDIDWNIKPSEIIFVVLPKHPFIARVFFNSTSEYLCMDFDPDLLELK